MTKRKDTLTPAATKPEAQQEHETEDPKEANRERLTSADVLRETQENLRLIAATLSGDYNPSRHNSASG